MWSLIDHIAPARKLIELLYNKVMNTLPIIADDWSPVELELIRLLLEIKTNDFSLGR